MKSEGRKRFEKKHPPRPPFGMFGPDFKGGEKGIFPPPPPPKEEIKMGGGCVPHPQVSYFPIPNFHHPYSDRNSIVDALKSIRVDPSLQYRAQIGERNGIPGRAGQASFNINMLNLLKSGKLIIP